MPAKPRKTERQERTDPMGGLPAEMQEQDPDVPPGEVPPRNPDGDATREDAERALETYRTSSPTGIPVEGEEDRHAEKKSED